MVITVSMKDALKMRPGASEDPFTRDKKGRVNGWQASFPLRAQDRLPELTYQPQPLVICTPMWKPEDFRAFRGLCDMVCSPDIETRMNAQAWLAQFKRKHGAEKCDMMLAEIRRLDADAWFKDKSKLKGA